MRRNYKQASIQFTTLGAPHTMLDCLFSSTSAGEGDRDFDSWGPPDFFLLKRVGLSHFFIRNRYVNT